MKAFEGKSYRNLFAECGKTEKEISQRLEEIWNVFFYGSEEERIYHPVGNDMGYLEDTGNHDARTEGMSYGMMICVQLNRKEEFDPIWKWACTYMWMDDGETEGGEEIKTEIIESISPQWLFYQSHADTSEGTEEKEYLDRLVNSWTKGRISDNELSEQISDFFRKQKLSVSSVNVQSHMLCLFPSANEIPDYTGMLQKEGGRYDFIGLYTDGQTDEEGRIMCYYWEAGVR